MKKTALFSVIGLTVFLVACGDEDEKVTNVPDNAPAEQASNVGTDTVTNISEDAPYNFTKFDLSVDFADNKSFEVDYDNESTGTEAKIEDDFSNKVITGNEAMDSLVTHFEKFTFDASTAEDKIIDEVLNSFNLSTDYKDFELDIRFADGVEKEINNKQ